MGRTGADIDSAYSRGLLDEQVGSCSLTGSIWHFDDYIRASFGHGGLPIMGSVWELDDGLSHGYTLMLLK